MNRLNRRKMTKGCCQKHKNAFCLLLTNSKKATGTVLSFLTYPNDPIGVFFESVFQKISVVKLQKKRKIETLRDIYLPHYKIILDTFYLFQILKILPEQTHCFRFCNFYSH